LVLAGTLLKGEERRKSGQVPPSRSTHRRGKVERKKKLGLSKKGDLRRTRAHQAVTKPLDDQSGFFPRGRGITEEPFFLSSSGGGDLGAGWGGKKKPKPSRDPGDFYQNAIPTGPRGRRAQEKSISNGGSFFGNTRPKRKNFILNGRGPKESLVTNQQDAQRGGKRIRSVATVHCTKGGGGYSERGREGRRFGCLGKASEQKKKIDGSTKEAPLTKDRREARRKGKEHSAPPHRPAR